MAVGVLALQGSFNEHIAGISSISLYLFIHMYIAIHSCMYIFNSVFLCVRVALRRIGVKGVEIRKAEQLENVSSLIIPGGESTTMAKLAEMHNLVIIFMHPMCSTKVLCENICCSFILVIKINVTNFFLSIIPLYTIFYPQK